jgi:fluoroacetyl-CoA thioesterase
MFDAISVGATGTKKLTVAAEHTAAAWGSGLLDVLSTPHMVALMEGAAVNAVDPLLPDGFRTVGTRLDVSHVAATPVGQEVTARAELIAIDGRRLVFRVEATSGAGVIGEGTHERFIIEVERFMARAAARAQGEG